MKQPQASHSMKTFSASGGQASEHPRASRTRTPGGRSSDPTNLTASHLARRIRRGDLTATEVIEAHLARIADVGGAIGAFITVLADDALERAHQLDRGAAAGKWLGPLHGVPFTAKDNIATAGVPTTAGSRILADWIPESDADVIARARAAGGILLAKDALFGFATGAPDSMFEPVRNPWDPHVYGGGSSSGSAAAVAACLTPLALGTDSGGSIRVPSSLNGVIGLKPTTGRVPMTGVVPFSYSLDVVGPLGRSVDDVALLYRVITATNRRRSAQQIRPLRVGRALPEEDVTTDAQVTNAANAAYDELIAAGMVDVGTLRLDLRLAQSTKNVFFAAEASEVHEAWYRTRPDDYHAPLRGILDRAERLPARDYVRARRVRASLIDQARELFETVDLLVMPTLPVAPFPVGTETLETARGRTPILPLVSRWTSIWSLVGAPAITVPFAKTTTGLPIGVQLAAAWDRERLLFEGASILMGSRPAETPPPQ